MADTSFMYMIAGLCMLKLYQKRHPDINASAYSAYACLAVIIFFSVVGVVSEHKRDPRQPLWASRRALTLWGEMEGGSVSPGESRGAPASKVC